MKIMPDASAAIGTDYRPKNPYEARPGGGTGSLHVKGDSAGIYVLEGPGKIGEDELYLRWQPEHRRATNGTARLTGLESRCFTGDSLRRR